MCIRDRLEVQLNYLILLRLYLSIPSIQRRFHLAHLFLHTFLLFLVVVPDLLLLLDDGAVARERFLQLLVLVLEGVHCDRQLLVLRYQVPAVSQQVLRYAQRLFEVLLERRDVGVDLFELFLGVVAHHAGGAALVH